MSLCMQAWETKNKELSWKDRSISCPQKAPKNYLYSEYVFQEPGAWIIHSYSALISLCGYQYANSSSVGIQNTLHAHKEPQGVHGSRVSKSIKNRNKYLNEIQLLIQPAVNMIKFTTDPQILLVETAGSSHFSSVSVAYCAMNHVFSKCFWIIYGFQHQLSLGRCNRALPSYSSKNYCYLMPS